MKDTSETAAKRHAGESAAERVEDEMVVGLGTGSTAACAIDALGARVDAGLDIAGVPTSFQSRERAKAAGIPLVSLDEVERVHVAIDGADEVLDGANALVKGGGAAHAREKVVDAFADEFLVVADRSKLVDELAHPVPVEVLPDARTTVAERIEALGGDPVRRDAARKDGPVVTDNGNLVLDCDFGGIGDPEALAADLSTIPGTVEHGLFVDLANAVHVGSHDGVDVRAR